jgi:hypothetical protein
MGREETALTALIEIGLREGLTLHMPQFETFTINPPPESKQTNAPPRAEVSPALIPDDWTRPNHILHKSYFGPKVASY